MLFFFIGPINTLLALDRALLFQMTWVGVRRLFLERVRRLGWPRKYNSYTHGVI